MFCPYDCSCDAEDSSDDDREDIQQDVFGFHHFTLSAQYAALIGPLAMLARWRALKEARFFFIAKDSPDLGLPAVLAPCCPNRMVLTLPPFLATTTCDLVGWLGVRLGLL